MRKILDKIVDVLTFVILAISLFVMMMSLTSSRDGISNIFNHTILTVQTNSMEPTFNVGDLLISEIYNKDYELQEGDIVTYKTIVDKYIVLNTHRIVEVKQGNDTKYYVTKGDNASSEDTTYLLGSDVLAVWNGFRIAGLGTVVDYLQSKTGFFICVLLPMIIFFLYSLLRFIKNVVEYNKEKAEEAALDKVNEFTEEQKQKAIQEYLEKQKQNQ